jgi:hypothetical protein
VTSDKNLRLHKNSKILEVQGLPGDFGLVLESEGGTVPLRCGAMILAPEPSVELRRMDGSPAPTLDELRDLGARDVVILPGGASSGLGCSCITPRGILYALSLARGIPGTQVSLLGREIRALGWAEELQRAAQEMGIRFFHIDRSLSRGCHPDKLERSIAGESLPAGRPGIGRYRADPRGPGYFRGLRCQWTRRRVSASIRGCTLRNGEERRFGLVTGWGTCLRDYNRKRAAAGRAPSCC